MCSTFLFFWANKRSHPLHHTCGCHSLCLVMRCFRIPYSSSWPKGHNKHWLLCIFLCFCLICLHTFPFSSYSFEQLGSSLHGHLPFGEPSSGRWSVSKWELKAWLCVKNMPQWHCLPGTCVSASLFVKILNLYLISNWLQYIVADSRLDKNGEQYYAADLKSVAIPDWKSDMATNSRSANICNLQDATGLGTWSANLTSGSIWVAAGLSASTWSDVTVLTALFLFCEGMP